MPRVKKNKEVKKKIGGTEEYLEYMWMELGDVTKLNIKNPMLEAEWEDPAAIPELIVETCRNPDYMHFFCKYILNIEEIFPYQTTILQTLWHKPFPMLIATRGGAKCITGDSLIISENGISTIKELVETDLINIPVDTKDKYLLGENGFKKVSYGWNSGFTNNKKISTNKGFVLEGTLNHPIRVVGKNEIIWKNLGDVTIEDRVVIDRSNNWFENTSDFPEDLSYLLGLLVGDGGYTKKGQISFTTADQELAESVINLSQKYLSRTFSKDKNNKYNYSIYSVDVWNKLFTEYGFNSSVCGEKNFPKVILNASKSSLASFMRGLFDTDGCVVSNRCQVEYSSKSYNLVKMLQFVLLKFGIISKISKYLHPELNTYYYKVLIRDKENITLFHEQIGFGLTRKKEILLKHVNSLSASNTNLDTIPKDLIFDSVQSLKKKLIDYRGYIAHGKTSTLTKLLSPSRWDKYEISYSTLSKILDLFKDLNNEAEFIYLQNIIDKKYYFDRIESIENTQGVTYDVNIPDDHSFISNGFISHNSWCLAVYCIMRAVLHQGCKIVVVGASLRQAQVLYNYIVSIWENAPVLRDIVGINSPPRSSPQGVYWNCGLSRVTFLPLGDGTTIRGQRASHIICDEMASIDSNIFDTVIAGFAATKSDGVAQSVIRRFKEKEMKRLNMISEEDALQINGSIATILKSNQIVTAGTAYYHFNHFYKRYCDHKEIILSGGKIKNRDGKEVQVASEDYALIQIPYTKIIDGIMDENVINKLALTMDKSIFDMEYNCIFVKDSDGFYLASTLEQATCPLGAYTFSPMIRGDINARYVMGIDPASENDRFAVSILEVDNDRQKIVYQWSTNRKDFEQLLKDGALKSDINDYNTFFLRHIQDLIRRFSIELICMDTGGGGVSIRELLKDKEKLNGEKDLIIDMDDENNNLPGRRILKMIEFSKYDWRMQAHYALKSDFTDKRLLFPEYDAAAIEADAYTNDLTGKKVDRLDTCYYEIQELKTEITLIRHGMTANNKESWDVPKLTGVDSNNIKKKLKRDRFTSLLLSNWAARLLMGDGEPCIPGGENKGIAGSLSTKDTIMTQPYHGKGFNKMKNAYQQMATSTPIVSVHGGRKIIF